MFLSTVAFRATKILPIFKSWYSCSFQSYLTPENRYASRWLLELTARAFRAIKILSIVRIDISLDHSFWSYQNPVNFKSWHSCSFQSCITPGKRYPSRQLSELTMVSELPKTWKTLCFLSTVEAGNRSFQSYKNVVSSGSWHSCQLYLSELSKILSTVGADIPVDCNF